jgi:hypothetical protein
MMTLLLTGNPKVFRKKAKNKRKRMKRKIMK